MVDPLWDQLNRRIDAQHRHLCDRLDALQRQLAELHEAHRAAQHALAQRCDAHDAYHRANEHRWGPARLIQRHPFRFALLVAALVALTAPHPPAALAWLLRLAGQALAP